MYLYKKTVSKLRSSPPDLLGLLVLLGFYAAIAACGDDTQSVSGLVVEVVPASLVGLQTLTVEDENRFRWTVDGGGRAFEGFTPSHLRDHMVQGQRLTIWFEERNGVLVLKEISD